MSPTVDPTSCTLCANKQFCSAQSLRRHFRRIHKRSPTSSSATEKLRADAKQMISDLFFKGLAKNEAIGVVLEKLTREEVPDLSEEDKKSLLMELKTIDLPLAYSDANVKIIPAMNNDEHHDELKMVSPVFFYKLVQNPDPESEDTESLMQAFWTAMSEVIEEEAKKKGTDAEEQDDHPPTPPPVPTPVYDQFETPKSSRSPKTPGAPKRRSSYDVFSSCPSKRPAIEPIPFPPLVPPPPPFPPTVHLTTISVYYDPHMEKLCVTTTGSHGI